MKLYFLLTLALFGCSRPPEITTEKTLRQALDPQATRGVGRIQLIGGYLQIGPAPGDGRQDLCVVDVKTSLAEMVPTITAATAGGVTTFAIEHPKYESSLGKVRNEWRVGLTPAHSLELTTGLMSGICELKLGGLAVTKLDARVEQGQFAIDFCNAPITVSCDVVAEVGTGQLRVRFPSDPAVGVRVRARKAVGGIQVEGLRAEKDTWVNESFATAKIKLDLALGSAFGEVVVEPGTNP